MKRGLAFSGGKDSWACLWLHESMLDDITVIWVNTGKNIPEVLHQVDKARAMCPNFIEVGTSQEQQTRQRGLPSDLVPVAFTDIGQAVAGEKPFRVQSYLDCCWNNISRPLLEAAQQLGITHLILGQRHADAHKGARTSGQLVGGVHYLHPIEDWSDQQVMSYLAGRMVLPEHFNLKHTSVDCYDCTAYRRDSVDKHAFIAARHPDLHAQYLKRKELLDSAIREVWELS
jgi:3'-phosphoadenosine 5'-phosphosulfate sulfotransferase (PAPS reductase)/FAD synthetase